MSLFVPAQLENNKRIARVPAKRAPLKPMSELEGGHVVNTLLDDQMCKPYVIKFPRINRTKN